ncbi:class I SAM-dependent methyltransferase, partial [Escherichia coli]|nr:class I SAM-dependent methyltransferase [Escherichia coli]
EGRVSRELKALGYDVTATDAVPAMLDAARHADSAHRYQLADAAALPFDAASFDLVMAYNVLMDLDDMQHALNEA